MTLFAVAALAFVAGVLAGVYGRGVYDRRRPISHTGHMPQTAATRTGVLLISAALIANLIVGVLLILTRARLEDSVQCQARYNALSGVARDERDTLAKATTATELDLWRTLRHDIRVGRLTSANLGTEISRFLVSTEKLQRARFANPYPSPTLCATVDG